MKVDFPYTDDPHGLTEVLSVLDVAVAQCFGIATGFVSNQEIDRMISRGMVPDGSRVYQIACLSCENALRRAISANKWRDKKFSKIGWINMLFDGYKSEAPCRHFEQFEAFVKGAREGLPYSAKLLEEIIIHARLMDVTQR